MGKQINSFGDLNREIKSISEKVISNVTNKCMDYLKEFITEETYEYGGLPNKKYFNGTGVPTFQFRDKAWEKSVLTKFNYMVRQRIYYDSKNLTQIKDAHRQRDELAAILNIFGTDKNNSKERQPYWDDFIKHLDKNIEKWILSEYENYGLELIPKDINWEIDI